MIKIKEHIKGLLKEGHELFTKTTIFSVGFINFWKMKTDIKAILCVFDFTINFKIKLLKLKTFFFHRYKLERKKKMKNKEKNIKLLKFHHFFKKPMVLFQFTEESIQLCMEDDC